jgi:hypothetical protein
MDSFYAELNTYHLMYYKIKRLNDTSYIKDIKFYLRNWPQSFPTPSERAKLLMRKILRNLELDLVRQHLFDVRYE